MRVLRAYNSKASFENVATRIKKENLLLTHYLHVLAALKEVKHVARIFSTYLVKKHHIDISSYYKQRSFANKTR